MWNEWKDDNLDSFASCIPENDPWEERGKALQPVMLISQKLLELLRWVRYQINAGKIFHFISILLSFLGYCIEYWSTIFKSVFELIGLCINTIHWKSEVNWMEITKDMVEWNYHTLWRNPAFWVSHAYLYNNTVSM